jgi:hypothetical protein
MLHRLLKESHSVSMHHSSSSNLDGVLLQVLVGLHIVLYGLFDHISGLLAVFLDPVGIELLVALGGAFLR